MEAKQSYKKKKKTTLISCRNSVECLCMCVCIGSVLSLTGVLHGQPERSSWRCAQESSDFCQEPEHQGTNVVYYCLLLSAGSSAASGGEEEAPNKSMN